MQPTIERVGHGPREVGRWSHIPVEPLSLTQSLAIGFVMVYKC